MVAGLTDAPAELQAVRVADDPVVAGLLFPGPVHIPFPVVLQGFFAVINAEAGDANVVEILADQVPFGYLVARVHVPVFVDHGVAGGVDGDLDAEVARFLDARMQRHQRQQGQEQQGKQAFHNRIGFRRRLR